MERTKGRQTSNKKCDLDLEKLAKRGAPLTAAAFANLRACVGGQMGEQLEFLVCKGFDDETRRSMGISDGRARASVARYDIVCSQLPALRRGAEEAKGAPGGWLSRCAEARWGVLHIAARE